MEELLIQVFIKVNENNCVTAVNSSIFLTDLTGWVQIDEGIGDKYVHAQGNYFHKTLTEENGVYQYKYVDGVVLERTTEEIQADIANIPIVLSEQEQTNMAIAELTMMVASLL
jgi:hypothetical protein